MSAGRIGRIHRERATQHVALHSGDLHMHELTGFDRGRDGRRGKRHEIQIRADAFVLENADPLVHKRHKAPSVTMAAMRPLLRWERLYHCSSWQGHMPTSRTQTHHERARSARPRKQEAAGSKRRRKRKRRRPAMHAGRLHAKPPPDTASPPDSAAAEAVRLTTPNPPLAAKDAAEDPAARSPTGRWRAWLPNPPPWPGRPQAW